MVKCPTPIIEAWHFTFLFSCMNTLQQSTYKHTNKVLYTYYISTTQSKFILFNSIHNKDSLIQFNQEINKDSLLTNHTERLCPEQIPGEFLSYFWIGLRVYMGFIGDFIPIPGSKDRWFPEQIPVEFVFLKLKLQSTDIL